MIKVCDCIMGSGKSSAAITYMNEHPYQKFVYITPYLDEAERIKVNCPGLRFVEPSNRIKDYGFSKTQHTAALIKEGRNITTTHQAFKGYAKETLDDIQRLGYILIIDENVDILESVELKSEDLRILVDAGYITPTNQVYKVLKDDYSGDVFREIFRLLKTRELLSFDGVDLDRVYYWLLPKELIAAFKDVYILTYLFNGQGLHHFLRLYDLKYSHIWVTHCDDGLYRFSNNPNYIPAYVQDLPNKIHLLDKPRLDEIGHSKFALSMNWFKNGEKVEQLKNNVYNVFNNLWRDVPTSSKLWGTYNSAYGQLKGKGYSKAFLTFNARATNGYRERDHLAYLANPFMNANEKIFYSSNNIYVNESDYALSIMVQWIWRSAIRDGKDIELYLPSRRMRDLLTNWMNTISKGGEKND